MIFLSSLIREFYTPLLGVFFLKSGSVLFRQLMNVVSQIHTFLFPSIYFFSNLQFFIQMLHLVSNKIAVILSMTIPLSRLISRIYMFLWNGLVCGIFSVFPIDLLAFLCTSKHSFGIFVPNLRIYRNVSFFTFDMNKVITSSFFSPALIWLFGISSCVKNF